MIAAQAPQRATYSRIWAPVLAAIFATFVLGPYPVSLSAGSARIQLWRLALVAVIAILAPAVVRPRGGTLRLPRTFIALGTLWLGWGMLSFTWTPSFLSGMEELVGLANGLMVTVLIASVASQSDRHLRALVACWSIALAFESLAALVEFAIRLHLPSPYTTGLGELGASTRYMTGTLGNPNDVAAFLLVGLPFCVSGVSMWTSRTRRLGSACTAVMAVAVIVLSNSRLCTVGLAVATVSYALLRKRGKRSYRVRLTYLVAVLVPIPLLLTKPRLVDKFRNLGSEWSLGGSARDRVSLFRHGWDAAYASSFRGLGIGGFEPSVQALPRQLASSGDTNPHNFVMELFSQYGVVVSAAFWIWFVLSFQAVRHERLELLAAGGADTRTRLLTAAVIGFVVFIPASSDPSSFIEQGTGWLLLGSLLAFVPQLGRSYGRASV